MFNRFIKISINICSAKTTILDMYGIFATRINIEPIKVIGVIIKEHNMLDKIKLEEKELNEFT